MKYLNILLATGLLLGSCATAAPASAQESCVERDVMISSLSEQYGEVRQFIGLSDEARIAVELFVSEETGGWTITVTKADGVACIVAVGDGFQMVVEAPKGEPL